MTLMLSKSNKGITFKERKTFWHYRWCVWSGFIEPDFTPIRCLKCSYWEFNERVVDAIGWTPCEIEVTCAKCGAKNSYWAYGYYQPWF